MSWGKSMWGGASNIQIPDTKNLKLIHMPGAGIDGVNFKSVPKDCKVCNVYEHEIPIAEYCLANILNWELKLFDKVIKFKKLDWSDSIIFNGPTHSEISNKTVGIYGYGKIGIEIAKRLKPFNINTIGFTRVLRKKDNYLKEVLLSNKLKKTVHKLDYLIICCPLTNITKGSINKSILSLMKKTAVIINIARGAIINEKDLYTVLNKKKIGGAIIDTWFKYPSDKSNKGFKPSTYSFNKLNNVVMTPHISAWSEEMIMRRCAVISNNIERLYFKKKLKNQIRF